MNTKNQADLWLIKCLATLLCVQALFARESKVVWLSELCDHAMSFGNKRMKK